MCCKAYLLVLNSVSFCCLWSFWFLLSGLKKSPAGWSILVTVFFLFITLNISCQFLLACRVSAEKSTDNLMGVPLYVTCCFSLAAFNILSLWCVLACSSLGVCCMGLSVLPGLEWVSPFPCQGSFQLRVSSTIFLDPLSLFLLRLL